MNKRPIGVFDSGLGGLSAVRQLIKLLPNEDIIYFGDTGRVPYGTRSFETIEKYARQDIRFLLEHDVKMIIAACGTVSSVAPEIAADLPVPYISVVKPACYAAARETIRGKIGVIGTSATISNGMYTRELLELSGGFEVFPQACPMFVPLVEAGWIDPMDEITQLIVRRYIRPLRSRGIDTLILGCTHYPLLSETIQKAMGSGVGLIDSGYEAANAAVRLLTREDMLNDRVQKGQCSFFVSDKIEGFSQIAGIFLGQRMEFDIQRVDIEMY